MSACEICQEIAGSPGAKFIERAGPGGPRAVPVGEHVTVMPSLGPLAELHALVMPTTHSLSSAAVDGEVRRAVWGLAERLRSVGTAAGRSTVIFEHGQASEGGGCGVSHAHVHVLTMTRSRRFALPPGEWREYTATLGYLQADATREHLLISLKPFSWALRYEADVRSQYLRRWIAAELGEAQWDWRQPTDRDLSLRAQAQRIAEFMTTVERAVA